MTTELTTEILQQIRADIADVKSEVVDVKRDVSDLRTHVDRGFERVDGQLLAMMELIGVALRKDQEHERRLDALEAR